MPKSPKRVGTIITPIKMKKHGVLTLSMAVTLLMMSSCSIFEGTGPDAVSCEITYLNLNTGYNASTESAADEGTSDANWKLVNIFNSPEHQTTIPTPNPAIVTPTSSSWAAPAADAAWISPLGNGNQWEYYNGWFVYETCFTLDDCCQTPAEGIINIRADNYVRVYMNNNLVADALNVDLFSPIVPSLEVNLIPHLQDGTNCLRVEVYNAQGSTGIATPHGLLVEGGITIEDCCAGHSN